VIKNNYIVTTFILVCSLSATNLNDFVGSWEGSESLSSPTMSYQGRETYVSFRHNANLDTNLIYTSNSDFIYNGYLGWAAHYFTHSKAENQVVFGRRFTTPLGILGSQEIVYNILENDGERMVLEFISEDGLTIHTLNLNLSLAVLSNDIDIYPQEASLEPNYPNPFNPATSIPVKISHKSSTRLSIYNSNGKFIKNIQNGLLEPGQYIFKWNGTNDQNVSVSAGTYIYKFSHGSNTLVRKMILLK